MKFPEIKSLKAAFPKTNIKTLQLMRRIAKRYDEFEGDERESVLKKLVEKHCPKTKAWADRCFSSPYYSPRMWRVTTMLYALDELLGTHGVEPMGMGNSRNERHAPAYEYLNAGDTYATTLIYDRDHDRIIISSWGDIVESDAKRPKSQQKINHEA